MYVIAIHLKGDRHKAKPQWAEVTRCFVCTPSGNRATLMRYAFTKVEG